MKTIGIYESVDGPRRSKSETALTHYALGRGLPKPEIWVGAWSDAMQMARAGDCILVMKLTQVGYTPQLMLANAHGAAMGGILVHVCELNIEASTAMSLIRAIVVGYGPLEAELAAAKQEAADWQTHCLQMESRFASRMMTRLADNHMENLKALRQHISAAGREVRDVLGSSPQEANDIEQEATNG